MAMNIKPDPNTLSMLSQMNAREAGDVRTVDIGRTGDARDRDSQQNARLIGRKTNSDTRVAGGLSSPEELNAAKTRAAEFSSTNREAPFGRISSNVNANGQRNIPLGQIIDIRV